MTGNGGYLAFYGLKEPPFSISPDRRFLYLGRSFSSVCDQMIEALRRREGLVVVIGESGRGKTAVCRAVIEDILRPEHLSIIVDPLLSVGDLLRQILDDFAPATANPATNTTNTPHDLVVRLDHFLTALAPEQLAVLLVDDAHHLSTEILKWLRVLSNLEDGRGKKLQIVLLGQPSLETALRRPDVQHLKQRIARRYRIVPMSDAEVQRYVTFRLGMGRGDRGGMKETDPTPVQPLKVSDETLAPFSRAAIRTLATVSGGVPRTLNLVADRALLFGSAHQRQVITPAIVRAASESLDLRVPLRARWSRRGVSGAVATVALVGALAALRVWPPRLPSPVFKSPARPAPAETVSTSASRSPESHAEYPAGTDRVSSNAELLPRGEAYLLVVASFRLEQNADQLAKRLAAQDLPAYARPDPGGGWFGVVVGPYASADEANELKARLAGKLGLTDTHVRVDRP